MKHFVLLMSILLHRKVTKNILLQVFVELFEIDALQLSKILNINLKLFIIYFLYLSKNFNTLESFKNFNTLERRIIIFF